MECETIIRNGIVVDGSGQQRFRADVAINKGQIVAIGNLEGMVSQTTIDAAGCMVSPGFIDVHVHSEKELVGGPDRWVGVEQGVTAQLLAPDGFSWCPLTGQLREEMRQYLQVFYGETAVEWGGATVSESLSLFSGNLPSHLILQVPHGAVRAAVMGWSTETANDEQLHKMGELTREWMEAGAVAFCTGLEYEPTIHSDLRELVELSKVTHEYGGIYVAHQRGPWGKKPNGTLETFEIAKQSGIPVHISHYTLDDVNAAHIRNGLDNGIDVSFDMYPYTAGCTHLLYYLPPWAQAGSPGDVLKRLASRSDRKRMAEHLSTAFPPERLRMATIKSAKYANWIGKTLDVAVQESGIPIEDLICEMLLDSDLQALFIYHWAPEREKFLRHTYEHPKHIVSTDGIFVKGSPHPRGYGTYPRILGSLVREQGWLTLEQAIYKMSGYPAERFRIRNRGLLKVGYAADIVIFDPERVQSRATFAEPRIAPEGIKHVMVDGEFVLTDGQVTGKLPGKVIQ